MMYELRIYRCMPGKLPELNKRFETITLKLWEKHGIRQAGFWTVLVGDSNLDLYYLLEWKDMAERERVWGGFMTDPEWIEKRNETEKNGPIVARVINQFLQPTSYSKVK
ncbi:MAG: NIPSNAP family protein [Burkholderiales bacterium]|nr:NIPSNAP family protein [Burkholderiales bacterium]